MYDYLSIQIEDDPNISSEIRSIRKLIAAVIYQAFQDATSDVPYTTRVAARRFFNITNPVFVFYCESLDFDPEYIVEKLKKRIQEIDSQRNKESG